MNRYSKTFISVVIKKEKEFQDSRRREPSVRHVTGNDQDYLRKIPRVVVQKSALL